MIFPEQFNDENLFASHKETINSLIRTLDQTHKKASFGRSATLSPTELKDAKAELNSKSRLFVTCSKLFVKSATEGSGGQISSHLSDCVSLLQEIFRIAGQLIATSARRSERDSLHSQLSEVARCFKLTLETVYKLKTAVEHQFISQIKVFEQKEEIDRFLIEAAACSPFMSHLMSHATQLANSLANLMKILKELH